MSYNDTLFGDELGGLLQEMDMFTIGDQMGNETLNGLDAVDRIVNGTVTEVGGWEERFLYLSRFWVQRVLVPTVVLIGVLGNLVTIYILTRRPMRSSTNV